MGVIIVQAAIWSYANNARKYFVTHVVRVNLNVAIAKKVRPGAPDTSNVCHKIATARFLDAATGRSASEARLR